MSQDEIHAIAQADTPANVQVPNTVAGLVVWGFTRFGTNLMLMMIACGVLIYGLQGIYADQRKDNGVILDIVRTQTTSTEKLANTLSELAKQVENNTKAIAEDHRLNNRTVQ